MIHRFVKVKKVYIICDYTHMRKGIDGLAILVQDAFKLDSYSDTVFLLSGWKRNRYKWLYFDGVRNLTQQELCWLLEGLSLS